MFRDVHWDNWGGFREHKRIPEASRRLGVTLLCCRDAPCGDCPLVSPLLAGSILTHEFLLEPNRLKSRFSSSIIHSLIRRGDNPFTHKVQNGFFCIASSRCGSHKAEQASLGALKKMKFAVSLVVAVIYPSLRSSGVKPSDCLCPRKCRRFKGLAGSLRHWVEWTRRGRSLNIGRRK